MRNTSGKSKVDHFNDGLSLIQQDILQFDISVSHIPLMAVVNCLHDLNPQKLSLKFRHLPIGLHFKVSVQTSTVDVLHDYEHLFMRFKSLIKFGDIWMV